MLDSRLLKVQAGDVFILPPQAPKRTRKRMVKRAWRLGNSNTESRGGHTSPIWRMEYGWGSSTSLNTAATEMPFIEAALLQTPGDGEEKYCRIKSTVIYNAGLSSEGGVGGALSGSPTRARPL